MNTTQNGQGRARISDALDECCQRVSEAYGKPDSTEWTNSDFIRLSHILYKRTHVQISPNTLKRIFGKIKTDARYYPQKATRDALALYIGFPDWDTFVEKHTLALQAETLVPVMTWPAQAPVLVEPPLPVPVKRRASHTWRYVLSGLALIVATIVFLKKLKEPALPEVRLICKNPVGENPHSAVFVLRGFEDAAELSDGFQIDFGDGRRVKLNGQDSIYSHYYEVPGRYFATLRSNGTTIDSATVYLHTDGWTATANMMHDTTRVYPIEVPALFRPGTFGVSAREVSRAGVDTNRTFFVDFINSRPTAISGDDFHLKLRLKTSLPRPGVRCSEVRITVGGEDTYHQIVIMKPGCVHWTKMQFSDVHRNGSTSALDFLGADLTHGGTVEMRVENRHARLLINGKKVFETTYNRPLHRIYGLSVKFAGIGAVESVELKDAKGKAAFEGNF